MRSQNVSFIGAGNLAWHLAPALDNTDYGVREVYSRDPVHAADLVGRLYQADVKSTLDFSNSPSGIFIIAVSDDVISEIAREIILPEDAILLHTSGSQPMSILGFSGTPNIGVFYPLQTFSKGKKVDFNDVPLLVESENNVTESVVVKLAKAISKKVLKVSSADRKVLHIAAVFASNFTTHMLSIAGALLDKQGMSLEILKPLISETINKALAIGPELAQTGPARRGDLEILDQHMEFLKDDETLAEVYKVISQHIVDQYQG